MNLIKASDITGMVFGRLTALAPTKSTAKASYNVQWDCQCLCGKVVSVNIYRLFSNHTKSCGCYSRDLCIERNKKALWSTHKQAGKKATAEYRAYHSAKNRCRRKTSKCYPNYGGRGIEFKFNSFEEFFAEVGTRPTKKHTLDRINNNGHYEKGNLRWATYKEQIENRRVKLITDFSIEELTKELARRNANVTQSNLST